MEQSKKMKAEKLKEWRKNNPEKAKAQRKKDSAKEYQKYPEKVKARCNKYYHEKYHKVHILKNYGVSEDEYQELLIKQNYKCAICDNLLKSKARLGVDHNHKTNKNRGLLCKKCNFNYRNAR